MLKSSMIGELVKAIAEAQTDYKALLASHKAKIPGKDGKPGFEYDYADLNDGYTALQNTLNSRGVAVVQDAYSVNHGVEVTTTLALGEQWIESKPLFMPVNGNAQAVGSAITYARRYSLFPMVGLAPADDDGGEAERNAPSPSKPAPKSRPPVDGLGARCTGKASAIATAIDTRLRELAGVRNATLAGTWRTSLVEAGVDVLKYGEVNVDRPSLLTIEDGTTLSDYLARTLEATQTGAGDPANADCARLWVKLRKLAPNRHTDESWREDWAKFAGINLWPDHPSMQQHQAAADGMRLALEELAAPP